MHKAKQNKTKTPSRIIYMFISRWHFDSEGRGSATLFRGRATYERN